jgi:hypothetical protein
MYLGWSPILSNFFHRNVVSRCDAAANYAKKLYGISGCKKLGAPLSSTSYLLL